MKNDAKSPAVDNSTDAPAEVAIPPDVHRQITRCAHGIDRVIDTTEAQRASLAWFFEQGIKHAAAGLPCEPPKHLLPDLPDLQVYCLLAWQRGWLRQLGYPNVAVQPMLPAQTDHPGAA